MDIHQPTTPNLQTIPAPAPFCQAPPPLYIGGAHGDEGRDDAVGDGESSSSKLNDAPFGCSFPSLPPAAPPLSFFPAATRRNTAATSMGMSVFTAAPAKGNGLGGIGNASCTSFATSAPDASHHHDALLSSGGVRVVMPSAFDTLGAGSTTSWYNNKYAIAAADGALVTPSATYAASLPPTPPPKTFEMNLPSSEATVRSSGSSSSVASAMSSPPCGASRTDILSPDDCPLPPVDQTQQLICPFASSSPSKQQQQQQQQQQQRPMAPMSLGGSIALCNTPSAVVLNAPSPSTNALVAAATIPTADAPTPSSVAITYREAVPEDTAKIIALRDAIDMTGAFSLMWDAEEMTDRISRRDPLLVLATTMVPCDDADDDDDDGDDENASPCGASNSTRAPSESLNSLVAGASFLSAISHPLSDTFPNIEGNPANDNVTAASAKRAAAAKKGGAVGVRGGGRRMREIVIGVGGIDLYESYEEEVLSVGSPPMRKEGAPVNTLHRIDKHFVACKGLLVHPKYQGLGIGGRMHKGRLQLLALINPTVKGVSLGVRAATDYDEVMSRMRHRHEEAAAKDPVNGHLDLSREDLLSITFHTSKAVVCMTHGHYGWDFGGVAPVDGGGVFITTCPIPELVAAYDPVEFPQLPYTSTATRKVRPAKVE